MAEEDVADDLPGSFGEERHPDIAPVPQGVHKPSLVVLTKGEPVDMPDGFVIGGRFRPDDKIHEGLQTNPQARRQSSTGNASSRFFLRN